MTIAASMVDAPRSHDSSAPLIHTNHIHLSRAGGSRLISALPPCAKPLKAQARPNDSSVHLHHSPTPTLRSPSTISNWAYHTDLLYVALNTSENMSGRPGGGGGRRVLLPPINFIFKLLQQHSTVQIWLYEQLAIRIEGKIRVHTSIYQRRRKLKAGAENTEANYK